MKVIIAGGGTAGHINPGLAIADKIKDENPKSEILFIGTKKGMENDLVPKAGFKIKSISAAGFSRKSKVKNIIVLLKFLLGVFQSIRILYKFKPNIVIGTGGYVSGPMVFSAKIMKKRILLHEQNALPGITNKVLSKYADVICTSYGESEKYLINAKKIVLTGNPIKQSLFQIDKNSARKRLGIVNNECYVLIYGGSLGAEKINDSVADMINKYDISGFYICFATGKKHYNTFLEKLNLAENSKIKVVPYIYDMDVQMNAADLLVTRGGAITISEANALGKPMLIIPSPYVAENHQMKNALALKNVKAAEIIEESMLSGDYLYNKIIEITTNKNILNSMSISSYKMGILDATNRIYNEFLKLDESKI